ncbi:hypothetical protein PybrP1_010052 [[Pythium] brassicae (nom. inval.)]|nr:hypothetical protein PybrP1_010052 [[Pythium] brassicae (nom. inval.)]
MAASDGFRLLLDLNGADDDELLYELVAADALQLQALDVHVGASPTIGTNAGAHHCVDSSFNDLPDATVLTTPAAAAPRKKASPPSPVPYAAAAGPGLDDARRKRHNANERRRTNALKSRLLIMREELAELEAHRAALAAAQGSDRFLQVVATIDRLRGEHAQLHARLRQWDMLNSTYQTIVSEFGGALPAPDGAASAAASEPPGSEDDSGDPLSDENAPIVQRVLFDAPMPLADALECVRRSYDEIAEFRSQQQFESLGGEVFGWRDKRLLDAQSLQFMLAQTFDAVLSQELVYKTWHLLTTLRLYRRIQPATAALRVLQRVTDDCVIARLSVGRGAQQHQTILLIARGRIDGGFLITYRSIPLSDAKQRFAETEGTYVNIFNWFMFLDTVSSSSRDGPACEVIFGGKVKNRSAEYLRYLMMEVVAGVVRWQTAVGHSKFRLTL